MDNKDTNIKVPLLSKVAYGMGDVGCNFSWMFVGNFLMIFYTDVFGISMGAVAALMLFSRFWDAINDPIIGALSDKTHSRWGALSSMAFNCSAFNILGFNFFILGTSRVVFDCEDYVYGNHILYLGSWIYLCKYTVWYIMWSNDTEYRRTCTDQYISICECNDCNWYY